MTFDLTLMILITLHTIRDLKDDTILGNDYIYDYILLFINNAVLKIKVFINWCYSSS